MSVSTAYIHFILSAHCHSLFSCRCVWVRVCGGNESRCVEFGDFVWGCLMLRMMMMMMMMMRNGDNDD